MVYYDLCCTQIKLYTFNFQVKPLGVIWGKFPQYNKDNTIMFDDLRRNFLMNPFNGLKIRPFRNAHTSRSTDKELLKLSAYLKKISTLSSFETLDHKHWEKYLTKSQLKINTPSMHVVTNFLPEMHFVIVRKLCRLITKQ